MEWHKIWFYVVGFYALVLFENFTMKQWFFEKRWRLIGISVAASLIPIFALDVFIYALSFDALKKTISEGNYGIAKMASEGLKTQVSNLVRYGQGRATGPGLIDAVRRGDEDFIRKVLISIVENTDNIKGAFIVTSEGIGWVGYRVGPDVKGKNFSYSDWYKGVSREWRPYVSEFYLEAGHYLFSIALPIRDSNRVIGILVLQPDMRNVFNPLDYKVGEDHVHHIALVDKRGFLVYYSGMKIDSILDYSSDPVVARVIKGSEGIEIGYNPIDKEERLSAFVPVKDHGWGIVVHQSVSNAFASVRKLTVILIVTSGVLVLAVGAFSYRGANLLLEVKTKTDELRQKLTLEKHHNSLMGFLNRQWRDVWEYTDEVIRGTCVLGDVGVFYVYEEESNRFMPYASYDLSDAPSGFAPGEGIRGQVAYGRGFHILNEVPDDTHLKIKSESTRTENDLLETIPEEIIYIPLLDRNNVIGLLEFGSLRHISEEELNNHEFCRRQIGAGLARIMIQTKLDSQQRLYQTLIDTIPDPVFYKDVNSVYIAANKAFCDMVGKSPGEIPRSTDFDFFPHEEAQKYIKDDAKVIASKKPLVIAEEPVTNSKGKTLWMMTIKTPVLGIVGEPLGCVGISRDITALREAEIKLQRQNEEFQVQSEELQAQSEELQVQMKELHIANIKLAEMSKAKSDFLANMSHELRTPLNVVIGFSEVLEDKLAGDLNGKQLEYVRDIQGSGKHLLSLINDILDIAKIESGKIELELSTFSLKDVLDSSLRMFRERAMKNNIRVSLSVEQNADIKIEADERKLKQVMFNLLSNAIKFTPDRGSVQIEAKKLRSYEVEKLGVSSSQLPNLSTSELVEISVEDTGIGVAEEDIPKLFKEFSKLDSYVKKHEGAGLGLAFSKKLVELHKGEIWVESEVGRGSKFIFRIPVRQTLEEIQTNKRRELSGKNLALIIDDDPKAIKIMEGTLKAEGFGVIKALSGREAMEVVKKHQPDIIILDLMMPEMDGFQVVDELRSNEETASTPIIILTAKLLTEDDRKRLQGTVTYLMEKGSLAKNKFVDVVKRTLKLVVS